MTAKTECIDERKKIAVKRRIGILGICILLFITAACGKSAAEKWQEQYDLGMRYLEEGSYEEAIVAFTAAIELDPKIAETYLGLAETYIAQNDFETAAEILQEGFEATGDDSLKTRLEELNSGNILDYWGNVRRMMGYDENGTLVYWHDYTYDTQKRKSSVTSYDASGNQTGYVELAYDESGREVVTYNYGPSDGAVGRIENLYHGAEKDQTYFNPDGTVQMRYSNEYDDAGNLIRRETYLASGSLDGFVMFTYDETGKRIRYESYNSDGSLESYTEYEYDSQGNCIKENTYDALGEMTRYIMNHYDESGKLLAEEQYSPDGSLVYSRTYE